MTTYNLATFPLGLHQSDIPSRSSFALSSTCTREYLYTSPSPPLRNIHIQVVVCADFSSPSQMSWLPLFRASIVHAIMLDDRSLHQNKILLSTHEFCSFRVSFATITETKFLLHHGLLQSPQMPLFPVLQTGSVVQ